MITSKRYKQYDAPTDIACKLRFGTWFDRTSTKSCQKPHLLEEYVINDQWISVKQGPSAMSLKNVGSASLRKNHGLVSSMNIKVIDLSTVPFYDNTLAGRRSSTSESEAGTMPLSDSEGSDSDNEGINPSTSLEGCNPTLWTKVEKRKKRFAIDYSDPWKIFAGRALASARGETLPTLKVWQGDLHRLSDPISPILFGKKFMDGMRSKKKIGKILFTDVKDVECKLHLIKYHTHWGNTLWHMASLPGNKGKWAKHLVGRIKSFLRGEADPIWTTDEKTAFYTEPDKLRDQCSRSFRLLEAIKTADGIFVQRYLAFPEEIWSWNKYDLFFLRNFNYILRDEFFDGECNEIVLTLTTFYSSLKATRKYFKDISLKEVPFESKKVSDETPTWLRSMLPLWETVLSWEFSEYKTFVIGILCQTRGCGTPPLIDVLRSKQKFVKTVTTPTVGLDGPTVGLIRAGMGKILNDLPDSAFTGLSTKARITLTTSACLENKVREGGTTQAISLELLRVSPDTLVPIRNLDTGIVDQHVARDTLSIGEFIFWHCVQKIAQTPLRELRKVFLLIVKEPGKARSVTKSLSYLKVVLDVVSKLCSHPLKKGISSSESGMSKESHGWEFFKSLFDKEEPNLFNVLKTEKQEVGHGQFITTETYKDVYVSSTDYETATDYMNHEVASIVSEAWMRKCGIPAYLRGLVNAICHHPRYVSFKAEGPLRNLGNPSTEEGIRWITTTRGILMGDPLTKPCLHLVNVLARVIAENCTKSEFLAKVFTNPMEVSGYFCSFAHPNGRL